MLHRLNILNSTKYKLHGAFDESENYQQMTYLIKYKSYILDESLKLTFTFL